MKRYQKPIGSKTKILFRLREEAETLPELYNFEEIFEFCFLIEEQENIYSDKEWKQKIGALLDILPAVRASLAESAEFTELHSEYKTLLKERLALTTQPPSKWNEDNRYAAEYSAIQKRLCEIRLEITRILYLLFLVNGLKLNPLEKPPFPLSSSVYF